jgi:hypothetical protein
MRARRNIPGSRALLYRRLIIIAGYSGSVAGYRRAGMS